MTGASRATRAGRPLLATLAGRRAIWSALLLASLAFRLAFVFSAPPRLMWRDGHFYEEIGWKLASQHVYAGENYWPPAYPFFIAGVYSITGRNLTALRVAEALLSTLTVALVGGLGSAIFSPAAGLTAAVLAAFHPVLAFLPITHYVENLLAFFSALAFGSFVFAVRRPGSLRWLLSGAVFGLFLLCKPTGSSFLPGLALGAWIQLGQLRRPRVAPALLFVLALLATLTPWMVRNYRTYHRVILLSTGGGAAFWRGNNPDANASTTSNPEPTGALYDSLAVRTNPSDKERYYYSQAWVWVRAHPARALQLYLVKMGHLWSLFPRTQTQTPYSIPAADWAQGVMSLVIFIGAFIGLARLAPFGVPFFPLAILSFTLVNSVFLMVMRYRMSFEVLLLWLAGLGYASLFEPRGTREAATST